MSGDDRDVLQHSTPPASVTDSATDRDASRKPSAILLFGMPGTGKGTQGRLLGTMNGLFHVSTGEIFRRLDRSTADGRTVRDLIDHGNLVPDDLAVRLWKQWLDEETRAGRFDPRCEVLLLDGIPRSVEQCHALESLVEVSGVVHLQPQNDDAIVGRLLQRGATDGRPDDRSEEIIRQRFEIYRQTTAPVLDYYPAEITHEINPLGTPIEVKKRILERIIPLIRRRTGLAG